MLDLKFTLVSQSSLILEIYPGVEFFPFLSSTLKALAV